MYLLNPIMSSAISLATKFTFHYVSIKSISDIVWSRYANIFTFHYVSIKSIYSHDKHPSLIVFTFHYVSIKSILAQT